MADGDMTNLYPPGNDGSKNGVGMITGDDGKNYIFQTPGGTGVGADGTTATLSAPSKVSFTVTQGNQVEGVTNQVAGPIGGTDGVG